MSAELRNQLAQRLACQLPPGPDSRELAHRLADGLLADCTLRIAAGHGGPIRPARRGDFWDGRSYTRISTEPDGRVAVEGYDGAQLVHRTTYNTATAEALALALIDGVKEILDARQ